MEQKPKSIRAELESAVSLKEWNLDAVSKLRDHFGRAALDAAEEAINLMFSDDDRAGCKALVYLKSPETLCVSIGDGDDGPSFEADLPGVLKLSTECMGNTDLDRLRSVLKLAIAHIDDMRAEG